MNAVPTSKAEFLNQKYKSKPSVRTKTQVLKPEIQSLITDTIDSPKWKHARLSKSMATYNGIMLGISQVKRHHRFCLKTKPLPNHTKQPPVSKMHPIIKIWVVVEKPYC